MAGLTTWTFEMWTPGLFVCRQLRAEKLWSAVRCWLGENEGEATGSEEGIRKRQAGLDGHLRKMADKPRWRQLQTERAKKEERKGVPIMKKG